MNNTKRIAVLRSLLLDFFFELHCTIVFSLAIQSPKE